MKRRGWLMTLTAGILCGLVLLGAAIWRGSDAPVVVPPAGTPPALTEVERAFYDAVAPPLRVAAAEARALTSQGEARSRNLFAIRAGQGRLQAELSEIEARLAATPAPARFAAGIAGYAPAAATMRRAMRAAEAAFLRFDWEAVGVATEQMATATAAMELTVRAVDQAAGVPALPASPAAARSLGTAAEQIGGVSDVDSLEPFTPAPVEQLEQLKTRRAAQPARSEQLPAVESPKAQIRGPSA